MAAGLKTGGRAKGTPNRSPASTSAVPAPPDARILPASRRRAREGGAGFPPYRLAAVATLVPYANNARTHSPAQVARIAASIREFGFTNPVLVDGKHGIIAGHGRVLAALSLGMAEVPTIELAHLSDAQRRAYVLADNRLALDAGWDDELLALELGELRDAGFDLALTGFELPELGVLLGDAPGLTDPEPKPRGAKTVVCPACQHEFAPGVTVTAAQAAESARP